MIGLRAGVGVVEGVEHGTKERHEDQDWLVPEVVAVHPDPVDVRVAGVVVLEGVPRRARHVLVVRRPHPHHVGRALRGEDVVHVLPGAHVLRGAVAVLGAAPRVPVAVHLVGEAEEDLRAQGLQAVGPGAG